AGPDDGRVHWRLVMLVAVACGAGILGLSGFRSHDPARPDSPPPRPPDAHYRVLPATRATRPPQLVVVSFAGSGGARLWGHWRHGARPHYVGHCGAPSAGNVGEWNAADWNSELDQFDRFLFHASVRLPFGPDEVVGGRTPCLQGDLSVLYRVLAKRGFRYDASQ